MRIDIRGRGVPLTAALLDHTEQRLRIALTRAGDRIERVVVRLGDANPAQGVGARFCRLSVMMKKAPPVRIVESGTDLYAAIDRAAERAGRNVAIRAGRLHERVRPAMPLAVASSRGAAADAFRN